MSAVFPMYVVQNRLAAVAPGQYKGTTHSIRQSLAGGVASCFIGYSVSLLRAVPLKGIMLGGYSCLKDLNKDPDTGTISTTNSVCCSATASAVAHSLTYPLHLARTVLMQEVPNGGRAYTEFVDVLTQRFKMSGVRGLYAGLLIWLCKMVQAATIEFAVNERALDWLRSD